MEWGISLNGRDSPSFPGIQYSSIGIPKIQSSWLIFFSFGFVFHFRKNQTKAFSFLLSVSPKKINNEKQTVVSSVWEMMSVLLNYKIRNQNYFLKCWNFPGSHSCSGGLDRIISSLPRPTAVSESDHRSNCAGILDQQISRDVKDGANML